MTRLKKGVSVVVPCYNSSKSIGELSRRIATVLTESRLEYEIILVNDGSTDNTWQILKDLVRSVPSVRAINLMRNYGQHNALLCGIRKATRELIVTMDDDLQHPPEEIPKLLAELSDTVDVVYGAPSSLVHGLWRNLASKSIKLILSLILENAVAQKVSAFRLFRTQLRDAFQDYNSPSISVDVLLSWGTTKYATVELTHNERQLGKSNYSFGKLFSYAFDMLTGYSTLPLRIASLTGFILTTFGCCIIMWVFLTAFLVGRTVPGFAFLTSIISIFSGTQLFALGIIGEYIARIHSRSMRLPAYAIKDELAEEG